jgi:fatty-acyl-CoA synthase
MRMLMAGALFRRAAGWGRDDVLYCALPLHTAAGVLAVSQVLASGATLALGRSAAADGFWDEVRHLGATGLQYTGELCRTLLARPPGPRDRDHGVRVAVGSGLRGESWEAFCERFGLARILEFYAAPDGNTLLVNLEGRAGAVGRIPFRRLGHARLIRYDAERDRHPRDQRNFCIECRPGEVGELIARIPKSERHGLGRFEGYTSEDATDKRIVRNVFRVGDLWVRSGDLLRRDGDGWVWFVDRVHGRYSLSSRGLSA